MLPSKAKTKFLWLICALATFAISAISAWAQESAVSYDQRAALAVQTLQSSYDLDTGLYKTTGWWNSANAITVLADYARVAHSSDYDFVFSNTLSRAQKEGPAFINRYYDDEGWWALAWIDVYNNTHDRRYLEAAKSIFADMTYGWDDTCSGGIWWSKDRNYKNAIANELFLSVAAQLANETKDAQERAAYLGWATREWKWFAHSGMINDKHLVNDGLTAKCENNQKTTWTYNQGVILGGLAALHTANHDASALTEANSIAEAAISSLTDAQGILHDTCEPKCGADGTQFKGIFVRNLRALDEASPKPRYSKFVLTNAASIWSQTHAPEYHLGEVWAAPFAASDASTQSSALDALVTAAQMSKREH
ncbi:MAG TPA: glycoside hydrolase family 76 protein [Acidobacteriaceae bacterium]|jgi:predicted alpha-1,6-mannanase (GH76 family)|nr:glycoside hydrolase family 76 protein [Acidobacteriaceae bacterium]